MCDLTQDVRVSSWWPDPPPPARDWCSLECPSSSHPESKKVKEHRYTVFVRECKSGVYTRSAGYEVGIETGLLCTCKSTVVLSTAIRSFLEQDRSFHKSELTVSESTNTASKAQNSSYSEQQFTSSSSS